MPGSFVVTYQSDPHFPADSDTVRALHLSCSSSCAQQQGPTTVTRQALLQGGNSNNEIGHIDKKVGLPYALSSRFSTPVLVFLCWQLIIVFLFEQ